MEKNISGKRAGESKTRTTRARLPAKLVSPDAQQAMQRPRLFNQIEEHEAACIWIHGPPGSGKTTLAASYLQARRLSPVWYQVDRDDAEISTFFFFLSMLFNSRVTRAHRVPAIDIENREDWQGFARRFFRAMLVGLADDDVLVFENIHEANGALDEVLGIFVSEAGQQRIILTSHHRPPPALVELMIKQQLAELNADALRFDLPETVELLNKTAGKATGNGATAAPLAPSEIERLNAIADGWGAGVVLLGSQPAIELTSGRFRSGSHGGLFDYFSKVVIEKMLPETRAVLDACAFLTDFDADLAMAASGNPRASDILQNLHRNGLFVERRIANKQAVFRFHTLLAQTLRERVSLNEEGESRNEAARQLAMVRTGNLLAASGRIEASIPLLMDGGDHRAAAINILKLAESIIAEGRIEQLSKWISALDSPVRAQLPWLDYWLGLSFAPTDEVASRRLLTDVYLRFKEGNDQLGCLLCAATIVSNIETGWQGFDGFDYWTDALLSNWVKDISFPSPESELRAIVGLLSVQVASTPSEHKFGDLADRVLSLIPMAKDVNTQLSAAISVMEWLGHGREHERALLFENFVAHEVRMAQASPSRKATWHWTMCMMHMAASMVLRKPALMETSHKHQLTAEQIAEAHDLTNLKINLAHAKAERCIWTLDVDSMRSMLDSIKPLLQPRYIRQNISHLNLRANLALLCGEAEEAWVAVSQMLAMTREAHFPIIHTSAYHVVAANTLAYLGRYDEAVARIELLRPTANAGNRQILETSILFMQALRATNQSEPRDLSAVAQFFCDLREKRMLEYGRLLRPLLARLCVVALSQNIESEFIRGFILHRKLLPPAQGSTRASANWPWPLRVEAFGEFRVSLADVTLTFDGKSQKKPLELLKMIASLQSASKDGLGPSVQSVIDELWPDLDAKDPQGSFEIALHRLRKLIGVEDALILAGGRISLNQELVWWDVMAFDALARSARPEDAMQALTLYKGPLLGSANFVWAAAARARLAALYTATVDRLATQLERVGDYQGAIALYELALQQDSLIESFYRGLMRCHAARGETTESLRSYRRCKELLLVVLSAAPTAETEALKSQIAVQAIF